ncbi:MAG TPA: stage II sporulation protein M [Candidatus Binataceae bacterium]|nr:stage II sporulation protein M [Candidatus Binataceae bacterium]
MNVADRDVRARLEALLDRAEQSSGHLSFDDVRQLAHLYRLSSAQLAVLRSRGRDPESMRHLNALCVRAYTHLQVAPPKRDTQVKQFYLARFPATLAATAWLQGVVAIVMIMGALSGAVIVAQNPTNIYAAIPSAMYPADDLERLVTSHTDREKFLARTPIAFGFKSVFSASLFVHNTGIGFLSFATGILAAVPTIILVFYNGITLGAFAWIFSRDDLWPMFWAWLLPHAIPELLAVTLCSTAGLLIGTAVLAPGRRGVAVALREAATPALELVTASVPLFVIAATLESFLRQSSISTAARFFAAALAVSAIAAYVWYVRRLASRNSALNLTWLTAAPHGESPDIDLTRAR